MAWPSSHKKDEIVAKVCNACQFEALSKGTHGALRAKQMAGEKAAKSLEPGDLAEKPGYVSAEILASSNNLASSLSQDRLGTTQIEGSPELANGGAPALAVLQRRR